MDSPILQDPENNVRNRVSEHFWELSFGSDHLLGLHIEAGRYDEKKNEQEPSAWTSRRWTQETKGHWITKAIGWTRRKWAGSGNRTGNTPITHLLPMLEFSSLGLTPLLINYSFQETL